MRICVYAGSNPGADPAYAESAADLARLLAERGIGVVYGGAHVGLMGILADTALAAGGEVIGVMPQALIDREIGHTGLTEVHTWSQLGIHDKPMGVLNVNGYYDGLAELLDHAVQEGFLRREHRAAM